VKFARITQRFVRKGTERKQLYQPLAHPAGLGSGNSENNWAEKDFPPQALERNFVRCLFPTFFSEQAIT
jgi:hypothetical protein